MAIRLKRVYDPQGPEDGLRVLCTHYWPRGVKKSSVDRWCRALGTPPQLIGPWRDGALDDATFRAAYAKAIESPEAQALLDELALISRQGTVTLLTSFRDLDRCHLGMLKEAIESRQASSHPT